MPLQVDKCFSWKFSALFWLHIIHSPVCWQAWPWEANLHIALGLCQQMLLHFFVFVPTLFHCSLVEVLQEASHQSAHLTPPGEASAAKWRTKIRTQCWYPQAETSQRYLSTNFVSFQNCPKRVLFWFHIFYLSARECNKFQNLQSFLGISEMPSAFI